MTMAVTPYQSALTEPDWLPGGFELQGIFEAEQAAQLPSVLTGQIIRPIIITYVKLSLTYVMI